MYICIYIYVCVYIGVCVCMDTVDTYEPVWLYVYFNIYISHMPQYMYTFLHISSCKIYIIGSKARTNPHKIQHSQTRQSVA